MNLFGRRKQTANQEQSTEKAQEIALTSAVPKEVQVEERAIGDLPDKIFIDKDGKWDEWSTQPGPQLDYSNIVTDILYGAYWRQNMMELFYCLPEVFAPVHEIASRVADAVWELRKEWNDEVDYKDEAFNRLFSQPNPLQTHKQLIYQAVCYEILCGKQFFYKNQPDVLPDEYRSVLSWFNLVASRVEIVPRKNVDLYSITEIKDLIWNYKIGNRAFDVDRVMPILHLNLSYGLDLCADTVSMLKGAEKAIQNLIPVYAARGAIYIKRGALGFFVSAKKDESGVTGLTKTEKTELENDYLRTYGVTGNKSTVGMTGLPVDYVRIGMTIAEMQPFDETLADAVAIYKVLRLPRHFVPSKDNSTFANADNDEKSFYGNVIIPWATKYAELFNNGFNFRANRRYVFPSYAHIPLLQENLKEKAEIDKIKTDTVILKYKEGIIKKNERQAELGYASLADGESYATDPENKDPLGVRLGVGGIQALQAVLANTSIAPEAKKVILVVVFGINDVDAAGMVKQIKPQTDGNNNTPPKAQGA